MWCLSLRFWTWSGTLNLNIDSFFFFFFVLSFTKARQALPHRFLWSLFFFFISCPMKPLYHKDHFIWRGNSHFSVSVPWFIYIWVDMTHFMTNSVVVFLDFPILQHWYRQTWLLSTSLLHIAPPSLHWMRERFSWSVITLDSVISSWLSCAHVNLESWDKYLLLLMLEWRGMLWVQMKLIYCLKETLT